MWECRFCKNKFDNLSKANQANHSRWCPSNPKRNDWNKNQGILNKFGNMKTFEVECEICLVVFEVKEREKLHPKREKYYCSRKCANSIGGKAKAEKTYSIETSSYGTICWKNHLKKCIVCGEEKIVAVHHNDGNHLNNNPENLIPLCPTHHQYVHSRYKEEVQPIIDKYIKDKWYN